MQLLHENNTVLMTVNRNMNNNRSIRDLSTNMDVKEKKSSNGSLLLMNPVASGDNVATGLSTHKLKEELPPLVPCCEGKELQINEDLVRSGLSAISLKHESVIQCLSLSRTSERMQMPPGQIKHRNSFRSLHRPDLKRVPYLRRLTPDELEILFRGYAADLQARGFPKSETREEQLLDQLSPDNNIPGKEIRSQEEAVTCSLLPILETHSRAEDIPVGMRLHGARARLYTSVLAGAKAGDQAEGMPTPEEFDTYVPNDPAPDDELLAEELQIILPPRHDDVTAESSITTTSTYQSIR